MGRNSRTLKILDFLTYRRVVVASGGSKSSTLKVLDVLSLYMADRRCLRQVEILRIEGLGILKPLLRGAVASGGSKSSKIEGLGFFKPLLSGAVASGGSKSSKIEGLGFLSLY